MQTSSSAFSAQYGVGGILYNQISKGGSNRFHGSAYEYFQNTALNANNYAFGANTPRRSSTSTSSAVRSEARSSAGSSSSSSTTITSLTMVAQRPDFIPSPRKPN